MRYILACDLMNGVVVRGVRGERGRYRPISEYSTVVSTSVPGEVIRAMRPRETYVADLDRITGKGDNLQIIASLSGLTRTMADTGISTADDAASVRSACHAIVLGTETAPLSLVEACQGPGIIVSVDMNQGRMMARDPALDAPPLAVVSMLNDVELDAVILLDVARVGSGEGVDLGLLAAAASSSRHPVIAGGGVRDMGDLELIERAGAAGVILASAAHSGAVPLNVLW